jgi:hypothetical protein
LLATLKQGGWGDDTKSVDLWTRWGAGAFHFNIELWGEGLHMMLIFPKGDRCDIFFLPG